MMYRQKTTLEQWRILQAVVDFGGYAQAAEKLNKSQSALNHAVAKLQQQLGVALLEVRGRKAYLTRHGEVLLRRSRNLSQAAAELEQLADTMEQGWEPEIRIAVEAIYPKDHLCQALSSFYPNSRGSRLMVLDSVLTGTEELINEHAVELAITGNVPKGFLGEPLCRVDMTPICHPEHALAQSPQPIRAEELAQHLQLVIKDTAQAPTEKQGWLKAEQRWTVSNFAEAKHLLLGGLGFAWFPTHLIEAELQQRRLHQIKLEGSAIRSSILHLVVPREHRLGPGGQLLREIILKQHGCQTDFSQASETE